MHLRFSITVQDTIAEQLAEHRSLRSVKRSLQSLIAQKLMTITPGDIDMLLIDTFDERINRIEESRSIGFRQ